MVVLMLFRNVRDPKEYLRHGNRQGVVNRKRCDAIPGSCAVSWGRSVLRGGGYGGGESASPVAAGAAPTTGQGGCPLRPRSERLTRDCVQVPGARHGVAARGRALEPRG